MALAYVLPQLQKLVLCDVAPLSPVSAAALSVACGKLSQDGRSFEVVLKGAAGFEKEMHDLVGLMHVYEPFVTVKTVTF